MSEQEREAWEHPHHPGCSQQGPYTEDCMQGPTGEYRAVICQECGVTVQVSYPAMGADKLAPSELTEFLAKQIERTFPH